MHSTRMKTAVGLLGATALCLSAPVQAFADAGGTQKSAYCGTDKASGLAVSAIGKVPCATASQVAAAYTKVWTDRTNAPLVVRAAGTTWKCQERQGGPDPYQQCVDTRDPGRQVTLSS